MNRAGESVYTEHDRRALSPMKFLYDYNFIKTASFVAGGLYGAQISRMQKTKIEHLERRALSSPLDVFVEPDGASFLAKTPELPLYGIGDSPVEAINMLKREIESLYEDLMGDDNYTGNWVNVKAFLQNRVLVGNEKQQLRM